MRAILLALPLLPTPLLADAIEDVIQGQIDAFLARDVAGAFAFASPMIQGIFGTPETFGAMVATGYPMVWSPDDVRMLDARPVDGATLKRVLLRDGAGKGWVLQYEMVETPDGWKINGVAILPEAEVGA